MILAIAFLLACLFCLPLFFGRPGDDPLSPSKITSVFHLVTVVPYLVLVGIDETIVHPLVRGHPAVGDLQSAIGWYAFVQACGFIALLWGMGWRSVDGVSDRIPVIGGAFDAGARYRIAALCAAVIGGAAFVVYIGRVGGLGYLLLHFEQRSLLAQGSGYLLMLVKPLFFAVVIAICSFRFRSSPAKWLGVLCLIVVSAFAFSALGGRKQTVLLVVWAIFAWHYGVRRFPRIRLRHALVLLPLVPYFIMIPILRAPGGFAHYMDYPNELAGDVLENISVAITHLSYVDTYVFVTSYFDIGNVWLGATYLDLLQAPIPGGLSQMKPPVDDGVYVLTLAEGGVVSPGMPFADLSPSSWPPETLGIMYLNFWIPGVVLGMFLLGALVRLSYTYMLRSGRTPYSIVVYGYIVLPFQLSNLGLVQGLSYLAIATVFFAFFFGWSSARAGPSP